MKTPYEILAIKESASDEEIKAAYLKKVREFPPEHHPEEFKRIKNAYDRVDTLRKRVSYRLFHLTEPTYENLLDAIEMRPGRRIEAKALVDIILEAGREQIGRF